MRIKTEKQQLRDQLQLLTQLHSYQDRRVKRALRRYNDKCNFPLAFWIGDNTDTLNYKWLQERNILETISDHVTVIEQRLLAIVD